MLKYVISKEVHKKGFKFFRSRKGKPKMNKMMFSTTKFTEVIKTTEPVVDDTKSMSALEHRNWLSIDGKMCDEGDRSNTIRIMSYNILASSNIMFHLYPRTEKRLLDWKYRFPLIIRELRAIDADIICLQEVTQQQLSDILSKMKPLGYDSEYLKKTGEREDGSLTLFRTSKLKLLSKTALRLNGEDFNISQPIRRILGPILSKENIALFLALQPVNSNDILLVGNTHLLYNPKRGDIKLGQQQIILQALRAMEEVIEKKYQAKTTVVLGGDFNLIPSSPLYQHIKTGTFNYFRTEMNEWSGQETSQELSLDNESRHFTEVTKTFMEEETENKDNTPRPRPRSQPKTDKLGKEEVAEILTKVHMEYDINKNKFLLKFNMGDRHQGWQREQQRTRPCCQHSYKDGLKSAYAEVNRCTEEFPDNNYGKTLFKQSKQTTMKGSEIARTYESGLSHCSHDFHCLVDYLWFKSELYHPKAILQLPSYKSFKSHIRHLPNEKYPSDHFSIAVDLCKEPAK